MSEKAVIEYSCDICHRKTSDEKDIRRFYGNVTVPNKGGLIGNNIWEQEDINTNDPSPALKKLIEAGQLSNSISSDTLITYTDICLSCIPESLRLI